MPVPIDVITAGCFAPETLDAPPRCELRERSGPVQPDAALSSFCPGLFGLGSGESASGLDPGENGASCTVRSCHDNDRCRTALHLMTNGALTGGTYDINGGQEEFLSE
jgi:hypothetical protein